MKSSRSGRFAVLQRVRSQYLWATALVVLIALGGSAVSLQAQVLYGSLVGNVTDESGAAVPGATVTVTHKETGASREAVTDTTGALSFPEPGSPGTYTVTVKVEGFRTFTRSDLPVTLNNVTRADAALQVGQLHRVGDGLRRDAAAADRPRRSAVRAEGGGARRTCRSRSTGTISICSACCRGSRRRPRRTRCRRTRHGPWCSTSTAPAAARTTSGSTASARPTSGCRTSPPTFRRSNRSRRSTS